MGTGQSNDAKNDEKAAAERQREEALYAELQKLIANTHYELLTYSYIIRQLERYSTQHFQMQLSKTDKERVQAAVDDSLRGHFRTQWKVGKVLGKGGYSTVHACTRVDDPSVPERAVKVVDKSKLSKNAMKSLVDEIDIMNKLNHPRLLTLFQVYDHGTICYMVLEKIDGGELFDEIVRLQRYAEKDAAEIMYNFLDGLKFMHDAGICHRDIKPENILLLKKPQTPTDICKELKLADFGFSSQVGNEEPLKTCCGTPRYIAPEVLMVGLFHKGTGYGKTCDLWAAGVIAFILLFGKAPFYHKDRDELWRHICHGIYTIPADGSVSQHARHFIQSLICVDRFQRLNVDQALAHPFINLRANAPNQHLAGAADNLREFNAREKVKGMVFGLQAVSRVTYMQKCMALGCKTNSAVEKKFDTGKLGDHTTELDLRNNYLGPNGLMAVLEMIHEGCPNLRKLDLAGNNVNNAVVQRLCQVAKTHPKIEHLDLSDNPLSFNAGRGILDLVKSNPRIKQVVLDGTKIQEGILNQIYRKLQANRDHSTRAEGDVQRGISQQQSLQITSPPSVPSPGTVPATAAANAHG